MNLAAATALSPGVVHAQARPEPMRLVVGFAPGGPTDAVARIAAEVLTTKLGASVVVENRPGASGAIAASAVSNAKPDGNTLLVNVVADIVNPVVARDKDAVITKRFMPVVMLAESPNVLVVHPSVKATTAKEFIELERTSPKDSFSYGSAGLGTVSHLSGVLFGDATGVPMLHVPYKGTGPAQVDLLAGRVPLMFDNLINGLANAKAGSVRALAVTSTKRWPGAPDLPTLAEAGLPDTDLVSVFGLLAPVGTPKPVVDRIASALLEGMAAPDVRNRLNQIGAEPGTLNAQAYGTYLDTQTQRWEKLVAAGKLDLK
ncbi:Bug family tripartite tricarboxylate transporter substrate binding protein [Pigmentiphaga litoralis]|uniref:Bug family tripartite tricarboxylate transporter substrate binding protein n=1 Tax=Pigmentiphaga litoralis TaxID=516702 RepID=UPI003B43A165